MSPGPPFALGYATNPGGWWCCFRGVRAAGCGRPVPSPSLAGVSRGHRASPPQPTQSRAVPGTVLPPGRHTEEGQQPPTGHQGLSERLSPPTAVNKGLLLGGLRASRPSALHRIKGHSEPRVELPPLRIQKHPSPQQTPVCTVESSFRPRRRPSSLGSPPSPVGAALGPCKGQGGPRGLWTHPGQVHVLPPHLPKYCSCWAMVSPMETVSSLPCVEML